MSNFTPTVAFNTEFEGDQISMKLSRLKRKDMMTVASMTDLDENGNGQLNQAAMMDFASAMLPRYVTDFTGLKDADGNAISIETVVEEAYFTDLTARIVERIFDISNLNRLDAKNLPEQPSTSIAAPEISVARSLPE